jgi:hypothetical protein
MADDRLDRRRPKRGDLGLTSAPVRQNWVFN